MRGCDIVLGKQAFIFGMISKLAYHRYVWPANANFDVFYSF